MLIFSAGLGAGIWAGRQSPVPPPPEQYMGEFAGNRGMPGGLMGHPPIDRAQLVAEIGRIGPQIKIYKTRIDEIDSEFEHDLRGILNPEQQAARAESMKRRQERFSQMMQGQNRRPFTDEEIWHLQQPSQKIFRMVVLTRELDEMSRELKLDDDQRARLLDLLRQRREKFLALVDSVPSPSVTLVHLASQIQRLEQPKP
jgi:Spy/CpxP family protein refolding chaperone